MKFYKVKLEGGRFDYVIVQGTEFLGHDGWSVRVENWLPIDFGELAEEQDQFPPAIVENPLDQPYPIFTDAFFVHAEETT